MLVFPIICCIFVEQKHIVMEKIKKHWIEIIILLSIAAIGIVLVTHVYQNPDCYSF